MINFFKKMFGPGTDFKDLVSKGAVIIDVRTPAEYSSNHILISRNIPLDQLTGQMEKIKKLEKPIICVCRSGMRSSNATSILKSNGIEAYNGGAWDSLDLKLR